MNAIEIEESMNLKFEDLYKTIVWALKANRSYIDVKRDWKWIIYIVVAHGTFFLLFFMVMYSTIFHDIKNKDFTQACANGVLALIFNVITLKYIVMVVYQTKIEEIIHHINKDYEMARTFSKQEQDIVLKYARKGKRLVKWWTCYSLVTCFLFGVKSVILMLYYTIFREFQLVHAYDITYPIIIEERKHEFHIYLILYILFIFYDVYAAIMYVGFVPLVPIFVLHACGQIEVVTARLLKIFDSNHPEHIIQRNIKDIIKHIQEIHCYVEKIKQSMIMFYELLLKVAVILLPVTAFQILKATATTLAKKLLTGFTSLHNMNKIGMSSIQEGQFRIEFFSVFIGTVAESGMPCVLGEALLESSENMRQAVYSCGWESHPHAGTRVLIKLLLLRTNRPLGLYTLFRVISRDALTDIYHHAYAIFNLMNAVFD